jgi:hypothetical protein
VRSSSACAAEHNPAAANTASNLKRFILLSPDTLFMCFGFSASGKVYRRAR